jgi:hypothetical protein
MGDNLKVVLPKFSSFAFFLQEWFSTKNRIGSVLFWENMGRLKERGLSINRPLYRNRYPRKKITCLQTFNKMKC